VEENVSLQKILASMIFIFSGLALANPASSPEQIEKGAKLYKTYCAICHGATGAGDGVAGKSLKPPPRNLIKDKFKLGDKPEQVFQAITKGLPGTTMAAFGHIAEGDRWALTHYLGSLRAKK
jgi:high-affinity iron transporter